MRINVHGSWDFFQALTKKTDAIFAGASLLDMLGSMFAASGQTTEWPLLDGITLEELPHND